MKTTQSTSPKISQVNGRIRFGENTVAVAGDTLWPGRSIGAGAAVKVINAGPWGVWISSDNDNDTGIEITVEYLEAVTLIEKTATAILDGFTFVPVLDADLVAISADFINRGWVSSEDDQLLGNCLISSDNTDVGGDGIPDTITDIEAIIPAGDQQTMQCILKVPADVIGCIDGWNSSLIANASSVNVKTKLKQLSPGGSWRTIDAMAVKNVGQNPDTIWPYCREFVASTILMIEIVTATNAVDITGNIYMKQDPA